MKCTKEQEAAMEAAYNTMWSDYKRINRMRTEPYFAPRKDILKQLASHMKSLQTIFILLEISGDFAEIPAIR